MTRCRRCQALQGPPLPIHIMVLTFITNPISLLTYV